MIRFLRTFTAVALVLASVMPIQRTYAAGSMTLLLVPHCTENNDCREFAVADGEHYETNKLVAGDILDLDVLVRGTQFADVRSVKSWIQYDPKVLEARSVELTSKLPSPTPGEQTIDASLGLVKIGGSTKGFSSSDTRIARVTFRVLETTANTELSFQGFSPSGNGNTSVNGDREKSEMEKGGLAAPPCISQILGCGGQTTPLLSGNPAKLTVKLVSETPSSIETVHAASVQSSSSSSASITSDVGNTAMQKVSSLAGEGSTFGILQVQDVRVTTKENAIYVGWQALRSSELAGYNVYYGTVSGRYIQRKSVPASDPSVVLRDLESGMTYYIAVRAVNTQGQESVFSQEVSITVGSPETATSPMTKLPPVVGSVITSPVTYYRGSTISGETGFGSVFLWVFVGSALIGTGFAFRRQLVLSSHVS